MSLEVSPRESVNLPTHIQEAITVGLASNNLLLLQYCDQLLSLKGLPVPFDLTHKRQALAAMAREGSAVTWLDTPLGEHDSSLPLDQLIAGKIDRTVTQIREHQAHAGLMCYVVVPALNEESSIGTMIDSIARQATGVPIAVIVADNNSTDRTADIVRHQGGNAIAARKPGVGAARQCAIDFALAMAPTDLSRTILLQTDADCVAAPGCIQSVAKAFAANQNLQIGVGPSIYAIPYENGSTITLASGKEFGDLLGTKGIRAYFEALGRDPADYLRKPPFRYLVGPNTSFRASFLKEMGLRYPEDGRWETLDLSIRLQHKLPGDEVIGTIPGQRMHVSPRAIIGEGTYLTAKRLAEIRKVGYVGMHKTDGVTTTPLDTVRRIIAEFDTATYALKKEERVAAIVDEAPTVHSTLRTTPALHAATGAPILRKVAIIAGS